MDKNNCKVSRFVDLVNGKCPLVFKQANDWSEKWTLDFISSLLDDKLIKCKISVIQLEEFQWETECLHVDITMTQYIDWLHDKVDSNNPLRLFDRNKFSCYIDYKYMKELFQDHPDILKSVSWEDFGLDDRDGQDSTIWIGSHGAYTPCHQDTYGFNLVAQLHGRKRWYMFDPSQSDFMYPTRIPYEESSIYSEVNIRYPDLNKHPMFQKSSPYIVELEPGDVLYVPRHWWHFVECLESTVTINTWVPLVADKQSRLDESCSRLLFSSLLSTLGPDIDTKQFLNTGEKLHDSKVNIQYLEHATQDLVDDKHTHCDNSDQTGNNGEGHNYEQTSDYFNKFVNKFKDEVVTSKGPNFKTKVNEISSGRILTDDYERPVNKDCEESSCRNSLNESVRERDSEIHGKKRKFDIERDVVESSSKTYNTSAGMTYSRTSYSNERGSICKSVSEIHGKKRIESDVIVPSNEKDNSLTDMTDINTSNTNERGSTFKCVSWCEERTTDKNCVQIHAVSSICFEDYVQFLEDKFDYERTIDSNTVSDELCDGDGKHKTKCDITLHDILNSILDPSVISHISSVLMKRIKT